VVLAIPVMKVVGAALAMVLLGGQTPAAKPNFSGVWTMNAAKSSFGGLPAPTLFTRTITHAEPAMTIVEEQRSEMGDQNSTRKYVTDGSESIFQSNNIDVKTSALWKDSTLVVESSVEAFGVTYHDTMSLSADGRTLTSIVHVTSPMGEVDFTVIFDKK
jgi:hypothetical protein